MDKKPIEHYEQAAQELPKTFLEMRFSATGLSDSEARTIEAKALFKENSELMGLLSGSTDGVLQKSVALAKHNEAIQTREAKQSKGSGTMLFLSLLNQIEDMESALAEKYGENFAEDLFSDLAEEGLIEDEEYRRIMGIEDQTERRQAIARSIQDGIESGRINPDDLQGHPWANDWLDLHEEASAQRDAEVKLVQEGKANANEVSTDAKYEGQDVSSNTNNRSMNEDFKAAAKGERTEAAEADHTARDSLAAFDPTKIDISFS